MKRRSRKLAPAVRNSMWRGYNSRRHGPWSGNMAYSLARLPFSPVPPPTSTAAHARLAARDCSSFAILLAKFMAGSPLPASAPTDLDVHPRPFLWPWWRGAASYPPPAPCRHAAPGGSPSRPRGCLRLWLRRIAGGSSSGRKPCGARVRPVPRIRASCRSARQWLSKCPRPRPLFPNWAAAIKPGLVVLVVLAFLTLESCEVLKINSGHAGRDRNRKFIPDRNADPVLHPSLLSGSPGGLRSTVFLKTLSGTIDRKSTRLLPSDEGNGGDAGQRMRASHPAGLPALKSSQSRGQLCHPMGSGVMGNRGSCLRKHLPLRDRKSRKHPDGLVTSDVPAVSKPPTLEEAEIASTRQRCSRQYLRNPEIGSTRQQHPRQPGKTRDRAAHVSSVGANPEPSIIGGNRWEV